MTKSNSLTNRILALVLTLVMVLGMMPSGFTSADAVSAGLMVYIDPLDEWIEKGYTLKVWSGSDVRLPTDDNGDGIYNFQLPSGWTVFELRVSDEESGYDYIYYTNDMEIPTDDRNLYTAESVEMVTEILGEITGSWSVYTPKSYTTVYFKPLQEWIDAGYRFNFSETPYAEFHFFTDSDGDGIYEVSLDSELVDQWRDGRNLHIQVREVGEDGWFSYKYYRQNVMPNDGSNLFTATALDEEYQNEIIGTWSVYTPGAVEPETPEVTYVAEVNGTKYETLAAAVAAAPPDETVKLLGNASGAGVKINKNITIDFGGYTYTFTEGVGSANTESNGLQILAGNTVTLKNGTLNVAAGSAGKFYTLIQNYADLTLTDLTLDGTNLDKWAKDVDNGDSYVLSINSGNVTLNNVNITANNDGDKAYAFDVCDHASYAGAPSVTVSGGTYNGKVDVSAIGASEFVITGGTFTDSGVAPYVHEDYKLESGTVVAKNFVAEVVGGKKYETLAAAVEAAAPGATVKLLGNASGAGVKINKNITIDFGGYTYTFTEGVGSANTESNGLQILAGNTVTLKNGTLNVAAGSAEKFYTLIQNYADLTLTGMNLDGTNLDKWSKTDGDSYVLSINSGNVTLNNVNITANNDGDKAYAFDVCDHASYAGAPTVTFNGGVVNGAVDVSAIGASTFTIEGGQFRDNALIGYVAYGKTMDESGKVITDTVIDTERELRDAIAKGGEVTLGGNITLTSPLTVDKAVTLNLNGFTLTLPEHDNYAIVVKDSLTLNGEGNVVVSGLYGIGLSTTCTGGLTVNEGVTVTGSNADYLIGAFNGKVTINGGNLTANYCVVNSFAGYNAAVEVKGGSLTADYPVLGTGITVSDAATLNVGEFLCVSGTTYYHSLSAAVEAVASGSTIKLLADTKDSFSVGNATGTASKNLTLDLNNHVLTLGPGVGSKGTNTNGIRVMAYSGLTVKDGKIVCSSVAEDKIKVGFANYGTLELQNVELTAGDLTQYTINNRGKLTLSGNTTVTDGAIAAITNDPYNLYYTENFNAELNCSSANVTVGNVLVERYERKSDNQGSVVLNISAGSFGTVTEDGASAIGLVGKISGGVFANDVSGYTLNTHTAVGETDGKFYVRLLQDGFQVEAAPASLVYEAGLTHQIKATGSDTTAAITYTVTEGNATVDANGLITINGVGTVTVLVSKAGDATYAPASSEYTFEVTKGVSSIKVEDVSLTFGVSTYTNPVEVVGDGKITYAISENDKGVTVDETGKLSFNTAVDQTGTYTVTVTMAEGTNYQGCTAAYNVTLSYAKTPENAYTFNAEINDNGWYEVETLMITPAEGYQICVLDNETGKLGSWSGNPLSYNNGVYEDITVFLMDENGNITAPIDLGTLQVDNVAPTATVEIVSPVVETIINKIFFVTKEDVTVKITVDDATSGIADAQFSLDSGKTYQSLGSDKVYTVTFNSDYRETIMVKVTDNAGFTFAAESPYVIVVDKTSPIFEKAEFLNYDALSNNVYFDNGKEFSVSYVVKENYLDLHDKTLTVTVNGKEEIWTLSDEGAVEKALTAEGVYQITATFVDVANNEPATVTMNYVVDTDAPTITLTPGIDLVKENVYYTSQKNYGLDITINESLYETYLAHGVKPVVTVNGEEVTLDWSKPAAKLMLSNNGVYEVTVSYENLVHEKVTETITIVVDHEEPVITLTPEIDLVENGVYYTAKENYELAISLTEDLYDHYLSCGIEPVVTVNGIETKLDWTKPETKLALPDNGVYEIVVNYQNHLHKAEEKSITIVVDHEEPVITLTPNIKLVEDGVYYTAQENYELAISLTEDLYDYYLSCGIEPVVTVNGTETKLDWTKSETKLALPDNGVYEVKVSYGHYLHTADEQTITIVVDHEAPVITLTPDITEVQNNVYYTAKEGYELTISLTEDLYDYYLSCGIKPVVTVNGEEVELDWTKPETKLALPDNGVYEVKVNYGHYLHKAAEQTITIVVDHEKPVIELLHGIEDPDLKVNDVYYTNDAAYELTIHLTEDLYDHYLNDCQIAPVVTVNGTVTELEWNKTGDNAVLKAVLPLTEDGVYEIKVTYGHYLHTADEQVITICKDTVIPEVSIEYRDAESKGTNHVNETVFADAVTAVIVVKDVNFDQGSVELVVTPSNAVGQTRTYTASWTEVTDDVWECALPLDVAADYDITFSCQDYANNSNNTAADLAVDIAELPDNYKFAYSTSVHGEILENLTLGFWRNQLTVTVDVVDDISGIQFVEASWSVAEDAYKEGNKDGNFTKEELEVKTIEETANGYRVTFLVPKDLLGTDNQVNGYITVVTYDYAGNTSTATDDVRVIADNVAPTRTVTETDPVNVADNVKYFDGDIVLRANIFEANYRFYDDAVISIIKDGKVYNEPGHVTGWYKDDATATSTITLTEDGDYVVSITYTDGSGNKMIDYSSGKMTLDTVAPVITVSNIKQDSANKDETYGFTITVNDINLNADSVKPLLTAVVRGEDGLYSTVEIDLGEGVRSNENQTVTYTVENLEQDALYKLTCSAEDMSKNLCNTIVLEDGKSYETVEFSINRNGSTYGFGSEYMTNLVNQYYVYEVYEDLIIEEVNVDPIEDYVVTVNGKELVEGTDYTTTQESKDGQWSKRTYTIPKTYFAEEGEYNVIVSSTDKAQTTAYSDIKDLAIAFVVDQTAPILTISGLQTGGRYQTDEQTVTLIPTDEGGRLNTLKVVVLESNGDPATDDEGNDISVRFDLSGQELLDYLAENGDMVTFTIPSGLEQQVKIVCTDCAVNDYGVTNEYNGTFSRVTVSQNALVIFYANKGAFYGTIGGVAALILLIILLVKRKKNEKK